MVLTTFSEIAATIIFTSFAVIVAVGIIADTLRLIAEVSEDEVREVPMKCDEPIIPHDEFELLYMSVANGDNADRAYWLSSVKVGANSDDF